MRMGVDARGFPMGVYVPLRQAAAHFGVSDDTLRRRIKAGSLPARQEETAAGFRWLVEVPELDAPQEAPQPTPHTPHADTQGAVGCTAETPQGAAHDGNGSGEITALRELVAVLREELEARRREVSELHMLLQRAQLVPVAVTVTPQEGGPVDQVRGKGEPPQRPWWWRLIFRAK